MRIGSQNRTRLGLSPQTHPKLAMCVSFFVLLSLAFLFVLRRRGSEDSMLLKTATQRNTPDHTHGLYCDDPSSYEGVWFVLFKRLQLVAETINLVSLISFPR